MQVAGKQPTLCFMSGSFPHIFLVKSMSHSRARTDTHFVCSKTEAHQASVEGYIRVAGMYCA